MEQMTMMRDGRATVYGGPPTWDPIEILRAYQFKAARIFLVGRSLPGNPTTGIEPESRMAVAWLQTAGQWTHDEAGRQSLGWEPLYIAIAPVYPPWPPQDHSDVVAILGGSARHGTSRL